MTNETQTNDTPPTKAAQLYAPWRQSWIEHLSAEETAAKDSNDPNAIPPTAKPKDATCFLRRYWLNPQDDAKNHVIARTGSPKTNKGGMILLNAYPYTGGHLLVALGDGRPHLNDYTPEQRAELWSLTDLATELCQTVCNPQGINVGCNIGRAAGAGVPEHTHIHVIPRWFGDTNFITTAGNVRLINAALDTFHQQYTEAWQRIQQRERETT